MIEELQTRLDTLREQRSDLARQLWIEQDRRDRALEECQAKVTVGDVSEEDLRDPSGALEDLEDSITTVKSAIEAGLDRAEQLLQDINEEAKLV